MRRIVDSAERKQLDRPVRNGAPFGFGQAVEDGNPFDQFFGQVRSFVPVIVEAVPATESAGPRVGSDRQTSADTVSARHPERRRRRWFHHPDRGSRAEPPRSPPGDAARR